MSEKDDEPVNIVVLCDGTLNFPTIDTNVHRLHMLLLSEAELSGFSEHPFELRYKEFKKENSKCQKNREISDEAFRHDDHYYEAGAGEKLDLIDSAIAKDINTKIKSAYRHIVRRYNDDKNKTRHKDIWLFGFSRGAYTVRCVAGMINNCGILKYDSDELIDRVYEIYRSRNPNHVPKGQESKSFRESFSHYEDVKIKFLGLWDTVGSHGLPSLKVDKGFEYLKFHDQNISKKVKNAYQVLAINERSAFFEPCRMFRRCRRCEGDEECGKDEEGGKGCKVWKGTKMEEVWFPGDHLEIGGGIFSVNSNISDESLYWMLRKILCTGGLLSEKPLEEKEKEEKKEETNELEVRLDELKNKLRDIKEVHKTNFLTRLLTRPSIRKVYSLFYYAKRASTIVSPARRDRIIPMYRNDKGMLTFDLLYNGGDWVFEKFKSIVSISSMDLHKYDEKPDSLTRLYTAMEDILIKELLTNNDKGEKTENENIKDIKERYNENDEKIKDLFREIKKIENGNRDIDSIMSNIKSFDAKTISKFNTKRVAHRYKCYRDKTSCKECNLYAWKAYMRDD
jgi:uncharacterized protein (DUF2235 family)